MSKALLQEAWTFLGVDRRASAEQVRAAWKRKLKDVHPDVGGTKEAAQHATNMRDVLIAWIEAGRPDPEAASHFTYSAYGSARTGAQGPAWQDVPQYQPPPPPNWSLMAIWAAALALFVLSAAIDSPRSGYGRMRTQQFDLRPYHLPLCTGTNLDDLLNGKCWLGKSQSRELLFATGPYGLPGLPPCTGMDIFAETKAIMDGQCWPPQRRSP